MGSRSSCWSTNTRRVVGIQKIYYLFHGVYVYVNDAEELLRCSRADHFTEGPTRKSVWIVETIFLSQQNWTNETILSKFLKHFYTYGPVFEGNKYLLSQLAQIFDASSDRMPSTFCFNSDYFVYMFVLSVIIFKLGVYWKVIRSRI